jgi:hypothetical protein
MKNIIKCLALDRKNKIFSVALKTGWEVNYRETGTDRRKMVRK